MQSPRAALLACLAATALILGASACSGDAKPTDAGAARSDATSEPHAGNGDDQSTDSDDDGGFTDEEIVDGLKAGTSAESVAFNGSTLELTFSEGSRDEPDLQPCSLAVGLSGDADHDVALVYPDGSYTCYGEDEG